MRIYILVEGENTEMALYPAWISYILPNLKRVDDFFNIENDSYYIASGYGYPAMIQNNHLINAIKDINDKGDIDYLIVCLDGDTVGVQGRKNEILTHLKVNNISLINNCKLEIIIQNICIETWLLGNKKMYSNGELNKNFIAYSKHYNVSINDPELMEKPKDYKNSKSIYHYCYLIEMLKPKLRYSKASPNNVITKKYFDSLQDRFNDTPNHLGSLKTLLDLLHSFIKFS